MNIYYLSDNMARLAPTTLDATAFKGCTNLKDIDVPWAEGDIAGAPWGATNATVHYTG